MDDWDEEGADRAIASWCARPGADEVIELFWRYGARDFRDIGHKAIYVANAWRTLQTIGWRHAEPVMRSLAFALLEHEGDNPAQRDADRTARGARTCERAARIRADWRRGKRRRRRRRPTCWPPCAPPRRRRPASKVVRAAQQGIDPASVWDGLFLRPANC